MNVANNGTSKRWKSLAAAALLGVALGTGGSILASELTASAARLNRPTDAEREGAGKLRLGSAGRAAGGDVVDVGNTRTISLFFNNHQTGDNIGMGSDTEIDVGTIVISNGTFSTTDFAIGGINIIKQDGRFLASFALETFKHQSHVFNPPLPLREGDFVEVVLATPTTGVEWDITLHGTIPGMANRGPAGTVTR